MPIPGGMSGAPLFDWTFIQNPLKLVGVARGSTQLSAPRDEPFPDASVPDGDDVESYVFGLASPADAFASLRGNATDQRTLGQLVADRWPY
jgi:hypothetical protein